MDSNTIFVAFRFPSKRAIEQTTAPRQIVVYLSGVRVESSLYLTAFFSLELDSKLLIVFYLLKLAMVYISLVVRLAWQPLLDLISTNGMRFLAYEDQQIRERERERPDVCCYC